MKDIRYSRKAGKFRKYFISSAVGLSFVTSMYGVGGIFMTSYLLYLGVTAPQIGFLAALPNLLNIIQVFSILLYRKFKSRKKVLITLRASQYLVQYLIIIVPRIVTDQYQFTVVAACFFFGHLFRALSGSGAINWNNMFVPPEIKGKHFSKRNLIGNAMFIVISLSLGQILDVYDKTYMAYVLILAVTLIFIALEIFSYSRIDDYNEDLIEPKPLKFKEMFTRPFKNRTYMAFIYFSLAWMFAQSLSNPYFTFYSKAVLLLEYTYIAFMGSIVAFMKIISAGIWGGRGDKKGWRKVLMFAGFAYAAANLLWAFLNPQTVFLYPVGIILRGLFMIGANIAVFNLNFELSPDEDRMMFFGFRAALVGIFAFIGPNLAAFIVKFITPIDLSLWGFGINGYQIVFLLSAIGQFVAVRQFVVYLKHKGLGERHT
ncbi:MAG: MFS transporter [Clostridia bacterium]|nr:MFS transporter [Clostridia bacterium]